MADTNSWAHIFCCFWFSYVWWGTSNSLLDFGKNLRHISFTVDAASKDISTGVGKLRAACGPPTLVETAIYLI